MTPASTASRAFSPAVALLAGLFCVQGACSLRSLDYLKNGHRQDGAARDSTDADATTPSTPSPDATLFDAIQPDSWASSGDVGADSGGEDWLMETPDVSGAGGSIGTDDVPASADAGGGAAGSGGVSGLDSPMDTGGIMGLGGSTPQGGSLGSGGYMNSGGTLGPDSATNVAATGGTTPDAPGGAGGIIGTGGTVGSGGATGSGGAVETGGASGSGGSSGSCTHANGVAVLTVPLTNPGQGQRFNYENHDGSGSYNLTGATLKIVACVPGATGGNLHVFFTTADRIDSTAANVALSTLTTGFTTVGIPVPAVSGGFDPATIMVIRIEIEAGSAFGTRWQTPATVVYIDSISTSDGRFNDTFDSGSAPLQYSGSRAVSASTLTWVSDYSR